jgi:alginate O-acetyltransferase complex protein AlgI
MLFNSTAYLFFLPTVFALFWLIKFKYRWIILLIASYYFYMSWNPQLVVLISGTTLISYATSLWIESTPDKRKKKLYMAIGVISSLIVLFYFKYFGFFLSILSDLSLLLVNQDLGFAVKLLLPVGISFYTFQTLSYVIDVYRGDIKAERHLGYYALFVSFFPQLVAGPIERPQNLIPQLRKETVFKYEEASYGIKIMAWGFFKKMVIADYLALSVNEVYNHVGSYNGFALVIATFLFAIQIYCDFSGYTDIAIGSAKLFGYHLMKNFDSPYFAQSIREFWARWHISLSTWFKDYLYIPLGGNRVSFKRHLVNLFLTFLISGLWHGANWTFILWGAMHGTFMVIETVIYRLTKHRTPSKALPAWLKAVLKTLLTFSLVLISWVLFRSNSLEDALYVYGSMFAGIASPLTYFKDGWAALRFSDPDWVRIILILGLLFLFDFSNLKTDLIQRIQNKPLYQRTALYVLIGLLMIMTYTSVTSKAFIYFQF